MRFTRVLQCALIAGVSAGAIGSSEAVTNTGLMLYDRCTTMPDADAVMSCSTSPTGCSNQDTSDLEIHCSFDTLEGVFTVSDIYRVYARVDGNSNGATAMLCFNHTSSTGTVSCGTPASKTTNGWTWLTGAPPSGSFNHNYSAQMIITLGEKNGSDTTAFKALSFYEN